MKNPLVSVLIPVYNSAHVLKETLDSVANQDYDNYEVIIANDCSTDGSLKIIQEYTEKYKNFFLYDNAQNMGISENRNILVSLAKGKYIMWQDSDDISLPNRMREQVELMESNPDVGICGGYLEIFNEKVIGIREYPLNDRGCRKVIFRFNPIALPVSMVRRDALEKVGKFSRAYKTSEDIDMLFRIATHYKMQNVGKVLLKYRQHDSATKRHLKNMEINVIKIRFKNRYNKKFNFNFVDYIYNVLQYLSIYIIPANIKIWLFNKIRNK